MCIYGLVRVSIGALVSAVVGGVTFKTVLDKMGYEKAPKTILEDIPDEEIEPEEYAE